MIEESYWSGDDDDANEGQECGELLLPGEGLAGDEQRADVAGEDRGEESEDGRFCEGHVEKGEVQAENTKESEETPSNQEREEVTGPEWIIGNVNIVAIREGEDGGEGLAREEDLEQVC